MPGMEAEEMTEELRCIIKHPDEKVGHVATIQNTLEAFQKAVDGFIETLPCGNQSVVVCNEEGKLRGLQKSFRYGVGYPKDIICGTVVVIGVDWKTGEFCDLPFSFATWKKLLEVWNK